MATNRQNQRVKEPDPTGKLKEKNKNNNGKDDRRTVAASLQRKEQGSETVTTALQRLMLWPPGDGSNCDEPSLEYMTPERRLPGQGTFSPTPLAKLFPGGGKVKGIQAMDGIEKRKMVGIDEEGEQVMNLDSGADFDSYDEEDHTRFPPTTHNTSATPFRNATSSQPLTTTSPFDLYDHSRPAAVPHKTPIAIHPKGSQYEPGSSDLLAPVMKDGVACMPPFPEGGHLSQNMVRHNNSLAKNQAVAILLPPDRCCESCKKHARTNWVYSGSAKKYRPFIGCWIDPKYPGQQCFECKSRGGRGCSFSSNNPAIVPGEVTGEMMGETAYLNQRVCTGEAIVGAYTFSPNRHTYLACLEYRGLVEYWRVQHIENRAEGVDHPLNALHEALEGVILDWRTQQEDDEDRD